jgi:hypothetical protein
VINHPPSTATGGLLRKPAVPATSATNLRPIHARPFLNRKGHEVPPLDPHARKSLPPFFVRFVLFNGKMLSSGPPIAAPFSCASPAFLLGCTSLFGFLWRHGRPYRSGDMHRIEGTSKNANLQPSLRDLLLFFPDFPPLSWRAESIRPSGTEFLEVPLRPERSF